MAGEPTHDRYPPPQFTLRRLFVGVAVVSIWLAVLSALGLLDLALLVLGISVLAVALNLFITTVVFLPYLIVAATWKLLRHVLAIAQRRLSRTSNRLPHMRRQSAEKRATSADTELVS